MRRLYILTTGACLGSKFCPVIWQFLPVELAKDNKMPFTAKYCCCSKRNIPKYFCFQTRSPYNKLSQIRILPVVLPFS
jgi:hypothetical protein